MTPNFSQSEVQTHLWEFIHEFRDQVVEKLAKKIDFIIIYGSAVRFEFVPGKSDVDIVIQIFKESDRVSVGKEATKLFWKTAKKYPELGFGEALSTSKEKKRNAIGKILEGMEKSAGLYVPVFIFVKGEVDWKRGELKQANLVREIGKRFLVPERTVFLRFKQEGVMLYGRDIRKTIKVKLTLMDRLRLGMVPQLVSLGGVLTVLFVPKKGLGYATKALLYQTDSLLATFDRYRQLERDKKIEESQKILLEQYTALLEKVLRLKLDHTKGFLKPRDFELFRDAVKLKWGHKKLGRFQTVWFCWRAFWFILRSNLRAVAYLLLMDRVKR